MAVCAHINWSMHTAISISILGISFLVHLWRRCRLLNQLHEARVGRTQVPLNCSWPRRISEVPCGCCFPESQWGSSALRSPELSGLSHHSALLKFSVLAVGKSGISPALIPKSFSSSLWCFCFLKRNWYELRSELKWDLLCLHVPFSFQHHGLTENSRTLTLQALALVRSSWWITAKYCTIGNASLNFSKSDYISTYTYSFFRKYLYVHLRVFLFN